MWISRNMSNMRGCFVPCYVSDYQVSVIKHLCLHLWEKKRIFCASVIDEELWMGLEVVHAKI